MTTRLTRLAVAMAGACFLAAAAPASVGDTKSGAAGQLPAVSDALANGLASNLCQSLKALPDGSRPEQYEAAIVYALSQANQPYGIRQAALDKLPGACSLAPGMVTGLNNAKVAFQNGGGTGTGGIDPGGNTGSGGFSSPGIDVGGGSANYTTGAGR
jgi:hypothetical protein